MILYETTKATTHSNDGKIGFFNIVTVVLHGDVLPYIFMINVDCSWVVNNGFTLKTRSKR